MPPDGGIFHDKFYFGETKMIHCYKLGGLNIVLDVFSGSVHVVDEVAYDVIEMYENKSHDEITDAILHQAQTISIVARNLRWHTLFLHNTQIFLQ